MKRINIFVISFVFVLMVNTIMFPFMANDLLPSDYGDVGENVKRIQEKLIELNYLDTKASGNYYGNTKKAIEQFQKDYGLAVNGKTDDATIAELNIAKYRIIRNGDTGKDVVALQDKLRELNSFSAKSTGNYLKQTSKAVTEFQNNNGLVATGIADIETQDALFNTNTFTGGSSTPISVTDGKDDNAEEIGFVKKLVRASEGSSVKDVQSKLKELGFFDGPISGYYMNQTIAAVKKFQEYNGLHITGETDELTWNAMFSNDGVVDINSTPAPSPEPILPKYALTIDVKNQAVLVYEKDINGEYKNLVKTMVCSTGLVSTPSDVGDWVLNGRKANWCYFPAYGSHAKYWTRINKYIAFHSVIYNSVNNMDLSVKSYNKLGSRASHGCIRLLVSDAKWIYDNVEAGTVVTITEDLPLDEELKQSLKVPPLNRKNMLPVSTPQPTAAPNYKKDGIPPLPLEKLKKGMSGEAVYWLQSKLKDLGFYTGTITGTYLSGTQNAVKKYQESLSLYTSGEADVDLLNVLYDDVLRPITPQPISTPIPIQITEPTPSPTKIP